MVTEAGLIEGFVVLDFGDLPTIEHATNLNDVSGQITGSSEP